MQPQQKNKDKDDNTSFLVTTYNPTNPHFIEILNRHKPILESSTYRQHIANLQIKVGSRRNKNLKDLLAKAKIPMPRDIVQGNPHHHSLRHSKCQSNGCRYCPKFDSVEQINSHITKRKYTWIQKVDCKSNNLVYLLTCNVCGQQYVGETKRTLGERLSEHLRDICYTHDRTKAPPPHGSQKTLHLWDVFVANHHIVLMISKLIS